MSRAFSGFYDSPLGRLRVSGEGPRISSIALVEGRGRTKLPPRIARSLDLYFTGERRKTAARFILKGTPLQKKVWRELSTIPWGESLSYSELARRVKKPRAVRAVASAVGKNPVAVLIPCHRVLAADGGLGGYAYGLKMKTWLLGHEKKHQR